MSHALPLVSIIIPVYNHDKYVAQALNTALEQSYPNIEIIIIDDGSKDKSSFVIEKLLEEWHLKNVQSRKITFIKQLNQGAHVTINRGLSLAKGNFLTILNSDDYYAPNRIEILVKQLQKQQAEWAFTGIQDIDDKGDPLSLDHYWKVWYENNIWGSCTQPTIGFQLLIDNIAVSSGNLFFSRDLFEKVGEFKDLKVFHDRDYTLRMLLFAEPLFVQEKLYFYRLHNSNTLHEAGHLVEKERRTIFQDYLLRISNQPPLNKLAPCHWYWPISFPKLRNDLFMDRAFFEDLVGPEIINNHQKEMISQKSSTKRLMTSGQKNKKITLITHSLCLSGAPKVVLDFATLLKKQGHKINIISLSDGPLRKEFAELGMSVYVIPNHLKYWQELTKRQKLWKLIKLLTAIYFKTKNTVICNCVVSWPVLFPLVLTAPFKKFFWFIHDSFSPASMIAPGMAMKMFNKIKNRSHLKTWFGSESTRKIWVEGIHGTVKYWSGISLSPVRQSEKKEIKKLLSIGTVTPRKGFHYLVDAFIKCVEEKLIPEDVTLTIIGFTELQGDTYLYELLMRKNKLNLKNRMFFVKNLEAFELQSFYNEADLYIQPSVVECLPLSLLQAMSFGLPIITTDVNGCTEAITDNETGYVCASRSSKDLAEAVTKAINNPQHSFQLGLNAQKKFNQEFCLEKTQEKIFSEI